eukprot:EG_transcript_48354
MISKGNLQKSALPQSFIIAASFWCSTFYEWQAHPSPPFNKPGCFFRHVTSLRGSMLVKGMAWLQLIICMAILAAPPCRLCQNGNARTTQGSFTPSQRVLLIDREASVHHRRRPPQPPRQRLRRPGQPGGGP